VNPNRTSEADSRKRVGEQYAQTGAEYDDLRIRNTRGALLTAHDLRLFESIFPTEQGSMVMVELGAGTGRFTLPVLERGFRVTATDYNDSLLETLREKLAERDFRDSCQVAVEDIFHLSFDDASIDFAYSIHVIPRFSQLSDQRAAILEVARTLKPGGRFLFNFRNAASLLYGRFDREHAASAREIDDILREAGLSVVLKRGKWILNGRVVDRIGRAASRVLAAIDASLWRFHPDRAWDVFVLAEKTASGAQAGTDAR
jgi:ubiquinone/menaquinone biosynthesis C-methylase UbiE